MSELLLRGWNVAVPVVDVGDDVFVIDDNDKTTWRLQVKTSRTTLVAAGQFSASFSLSRAQLRTVQPIELLYMFMLRLADRWRFIVVPRADLSAARERYVEVARAVPRRGRPPVADEGAKGDAIGLIIELEGAGARAWETSLTPYLDSWPDVLPVVATGPGTSVTGARGGGLVP